jgi:hypothetical protein
MPWHFLLIPPEVLHGLMTVRLTLVQMVAKVQVQLAARA